MDGDQQNNDTLILSNIVSVINFGVCAPTSGNSKTNCSKFEVSFIYSFMYVIHTYTCTKVVDFKKLEFSIKKCMHMYILERNANFILSI